MKYWAFISYSHIDQRWAEWLHRALETYRIPKSLVGKETEAGKVPPRVYPIFRDRDELRASADLGSNIKQALAESRALIVICSPAAARARWVGEEIKAFKKLGRENSILGLIIEGEPNVSGGTAGLTSPNECFPAALRFGLGADGELSSEPREPLAADLRDDRDGKNGAKLKLLASLLALNFDDLRRRDHERRVRRARALGALALILLIIFAALTIWALRSERQTQRLLVASDSEQAEELFQKNNAPGALAFLARATERDPDRRSTAATRLWFALTQRSWPVPVSEPMRHGGPITSAMFADERRVLTASEDGTARIWDADSGAEIKGLAHKLAVRGALMTKDGSKIISVCDDAAARLWDSHSFALLSAWPEHPDKITSLALSARDQFAATGSMDGTLRVSRLTSGEIVFREKQTENVHTIVFHPSDENLFITVSGKSATVWRLAEGVPFCEIAHADDVTSASFSPNGEYVLTCSSDGTVRLTEIATKKNTEVKYDEPVSRVSFSPDGNSIAVGVGRRVYFQRTSGEALPHFLESEQAVTAFKFSSDNQTLYVGCDDGKVQAWNVANGQAFGEPIREVGPIITLDLSGDGKKLLVATGASVLRIWQPPPQNPVAQVWKQEGQVGLSAINPRGDRLFLALGKSGRLWDLSNSQQIGKALEHQSEILCAAFSPDGKYLLTGSADETAHLWLAATGESVGEMSSHQGSIIHVAFHPSGASFITASETGAAQLWDTASRTMLGKVMTHEGKITSVDFEPNGRRFLTAGMDGTIKIWRSDNAEPSGLVLLAKGEFTCARFSPKGDRIAAGLSDGNCQLWSASNGQPAGAEIFLESGVTDLTFSHDGKLLATSAGDTVAIWKSSDGRWQEQLPKQSAVVSAIAFSPDATTIATGGEDGVVRLWDASTGRPLSEELRHAAGVRGLAFNGDGTALFCAGGDTLRAWNVDIDLTSSDRASLAAFTREFSSISLRESARLQPHVPAGLGKLRQLGAASSKDVSLLVDWICSSASERTLTPFSQKKLNSTP